IGGEVMSCFVLTVAASVQALAVVVDPLILLKFLATVQALAVRTSLVPFDTREKPYLHVCPGIG
ncbi:12682_t:CDS:1, partial [Funneliformis caledonium]